MRSHPGILIALASILVILHTLTNGQYGFHRDELATLDDARYLAWGYVAYPPVTPFIARMALELQRARYHRNAQSSSRQPNGHRDGSPVGH